VIELDELQHLIQKKEFKFKYGRLSIDKTKEVVILPSRTEQKKTEKKS
jgi:hypothetical protein